MKKLMAIIMLCALFLCGCSGNAKLAGVYKAENAPPNGDTIILYKDGSCQYLGKDNGKWSVKGDDLTVTIQHPDHYYVDAYMDDTVHPYFLDAYGYTFRDAAPDILSWEVYERENMVRVKVSSKDDMKKICKVLAGLEDVSKAEEYVLTGGKSKYKFKVADNCLIREMAGGDLIYVKK